jgi:hypothetical protein
LGSDGGLEWLIAELARSRHVRHVHVKKGCASVTLQRD